MPKLQKRNHRSNLLFEYENSMEKQGYADRTTRAYSDWAFRLIEFCHTETGKWVHPKDILPAQVNAFMLSLAHLSPYSASHARSALNHFLRYCQNPQTVPGPRKLPEHVPTLLSFREGAKICETLEQWRLLAWCVFGGGEKPRSACTLTCDDVQIENKTLYLREWLTFIPANVVSAFVAHKQAMRTLHAELHTGEDWFFPSQKSFKLPTTPAGFVQTLRSLDTDALGITKIVTPIVLFHSFGALAFEHKQTFAWVQKRMGYTGVTTVQKIWWSVRIAETAKTGLPS